VAAATAALAWPMLARSAAWRTCARRCPCGQSGVRGSSTAPESECCVTVRGTVSRARSSGPGSVSVSASGDVVAVLGAGRVLVLVAMQRCGRQRSEGRAAVLGCRVPVAMWGVEGEEEEAVLGTLRRGGRARCVAGGWQWR
jgi:hypothetical protein